jgi:hypothetical protein
MLKYGCIQVQNHSIQVSSHFLYKFTIFSAISSMFIHFMFNAQIKSISNANAENQLFLQKFIKFSSIK